MIGFRTLLFPVATLFCALALAACSGQSRDSGDPSAETLRKQTIQAMELRWDGNWGGSMLALEALVADNPDHARLRVLLGQAYELMSIKAKGDAAEREYDAKALEQYRKAVELTPDLDEARLDLARSLSAQDDVQAAKEHIEYVLERDPDNKDAHWQLGLTLWGQDLAAQARPHFLASLGDDLDPDLAGQERVFTFTRQDGYATTAGHRLDAPVELRFVIDDPVLYQGVLISPEREKDYLQATLTVAMAQSLKDLPARPSTEQIEQAGQAALDRLREMDNLARVGLEPVSLQILSMEPVEE